MDKPFGIFCTKASFGTVRQELKRMISKMITLKLTTLPREMSLNKEYLLSSLMLWAHLNVFQRWVSWHQKESWQKFHLLLREKWAPWLSNKKVKPEAIMKSECILRVHQTSYLKNAHIALIRMELSRISTQLPMCHRNFWEKVSRMARKIRTEAFTREPLRNLQIKLTERSSLHSMTCQSVNLTTLKLKITISPRRKIESSSSKIWLLLVFLDCKIHCVTLFMIRSKLAMEQASRSSCALVITLTLPQPFLRTLVL